MGLSHAETIGQSDMLGLCTLGKPSVGVSNWTAIIGSMGVGAPGSRRRDFDSVPRSSQHKIQYFRSFTISLASILISDFST